jgi:hypothetical protein
MNHFMQNNHIDNIIKIYYGLIREPDMSFPDEADDEGGEEGEKPKVLLGIF